MLSRVANTLYWMNRYLERAENISRFIEVQWHLSLDQPDDFGQMWEPLVSVTGDLSLFYDRYEEASRENVINFLAFDQDYPNSILSCLNQTRENARTVREVITPEMWEQVNVFYHLVQDLARQPEQVFENPYAFCEEVQRRGLLFSGMSLDSTPHDEAWHFLRMGRRLERADKTSRILDVKYFVLLPSLEDVGGSVDEIQWSALLRATSGLGPYRRAHGRIRPSRVAEFLLQDRFFPRSVRHCLGMVQQSLHGISGSPLDAFSNRAEQLLAQVYNDLAFRGIDDIMTEGLHEFVDQLQIRLNAVDDAIHDVFFSWPD